MNTTTLTTNTTEPPPDAAEPYYRLARSDDPLTATSRALNLTHLAMVEQSTPAPDDLVPDHVSKLAVRFGISKVVAAHYADAGLMLQAFPQLHQLFRSGAFTIRHIQQVTEAVEAVAPDKRAEVEQEILKALKPTVPNQQVPTPRAAYNKVKAIVGDRDKLATPLDDTPPMDTNSPELVIDRSQYETTAFTLTVPRLRGVELHKAVKAASLKRGCSMGEAFLAMLEQNITTEVTLNLYKAVGSQPRGVFAEDHWLSEAASCEWLAKVTHLAAPGYTSTEGYQPTELLRASVIGRDGHCRFPGCDAPGYTCDIDHVHRHADGGPTSTANMHLLCRTHHRLKTAGTWDVALYADGTEVWTSHGDGHEVVTVPDGPLARESFAERGVRKARVVRKLNEEKLNADPMMPRGLSITREELQKMLNCASVEEIKEELQRRINSEITIANAIAELAREQLNSQIAQLEQLKKDEEEPPF
ncbi:HNH endonuclease signature motif containing protein [uncultured Corynebacterium sp.]|uniref:HNH endonuclease signature motif containing protein n=1 Tax=uncultured Corynebacterium sp. TaxID=159447 RepID=UPI002616F89C|nr:HNH endonuclease signature motif containing protein [uncultured Corynebacterium sp.]